VVEEQTHLGSRGEGRRLLEQFKGLEEQLRGGIGPGRVQFDSWSHHLVVLDGDLESEAKQPGCLQVVVGPRNH
jgi:hypothetical protein